MLSREAARDGPADRHGRHAHPRGALDSTAGGSGGRASAAGGMNPSWLDQVLHGYLTVVLVGRHSTMIRPGTAALLARPGALARRRWSGPSGRERTGLIVGRWACRLPVLPGSVGPGQPVRFLGPSHVPCGVVGCLTRDMRKRSSQVKPPRYRKGWRWVLYRAVTVPCSPLCGC
jgi:hypothetical protein